MRLGCTSRRQATGGPTALVTSRVASRLARCWAVPARTSGTRSVWRAGWPTQFELASNESLTDALAVVSELAMKRSASFGRAPVSTDVQIAARLLGYTGECTAEFAEWREGALHGADHDYDLRRSIVDAVPDAELRLPPQVPALLDEYRDSLRQALSI